MRRDLPEVERIRETEPLPASARDVIAVLGPLVVASRHARIEAVLAARTRAVIPVLDRLSDPHNGAAVMRTADAMGLQEVHVVQDRRDFVASSRVSKSADRWLDVVRSDDAEACMTLLRARGYRVLVARMDGSIAPADLAAIPRVAIVFGNEHTGVSEDFDRAADGAYAIPMHGFVESLNVSVAAAITLHAAISGRARGLAPEDAETLRARFLLHSVEHGALIVEEQLARQAKARL